VTSSLARATTAPEPTAAPEATTPPQTTQAPQPTPVPAQQRLGPHWYTGSADAIYQSLNLIYDDQPEIVIVFGADHVYRMDVMQMIDQHVASGAGVTVAAIPVPRLEATEFGVIQTGADGRTVEAFLEKPADPPALPGGGARPPGCFPLHRSARSPMARPSGNQASLSSRDD